MMMCYFDQSTNLKISVLGQAGLAINRLPPAKPNTWEEDKLIHTMWFASQEITASKWSEAYPSIQVTGDDDENNFVTGVWNWFILHFVGLLLQVLTLQTSHARKTILKQENWQWSSLRSKVLSFASAYFQCIQVARFNLFVEQGRQRRPKKIGPTCSRLPGPNIFHDSVVCLIRNCERHKLILSSGWRLDIFWGHGFGQIFARVIMNMSLTFSIKVGHMKYSLSANSTYIQLKLMDLNNLFRWQGKPSEHLIDRSKP